MTDIKNGNERPDYDWNRLQPGDVRVEGDEIVIPLVEEILVKKPVVREVLRIRKKTLVERRTVEEDLRREDVEIDERDLPGEDARDRD